MIASELMSGLDISAEARVAIGRQVERILAHSSFRNSRRCQAFLRYVIEEKLDGNAVHLKERMIGIAVFHQALDYDTNSNSVVRVTAGEVRRRLAQYYVEADSDNEVLIELPLGGYVPEFRMLEPMMLDEVMLPELGLMSAIEEPGQSTIHWPFAVAEPKRWSSRSVTMFSLLVIAILFAGGAIAFGIQSRLNTSASDRIWQGAFNGQNVLLCAGALYHFPNGPTTAEGQPARPEYSGFSFTTARTAAVIGSAIGHAGGETTLQPAQDVKVEDLEHSPAVLIGAFSNEWTMRLQSPLRYQFSRKPNAPDAIVDTKQPNATRYIEENHLTRDYGIFAHFTSPATGQPTVIAAGLGMHGTAAVRIFLSSPKLLKDFSSSAPHGWEKGNYEILLASDLVNNLAAPPRIVDVYYW